MLWKIRKNVRSVRKLFRRGGKINSDEGQLLDKMKCVAFFFSPDFLKQTDGAKIRVIITLISEMQIIL